MDNSNTPNVGQFDPLHAAASPWQSAAPGRTLAGAAENVVD